MRAFITGYRRRPARVKRAIRPSSEGAFSGSFALSAARSSSRAVTSTSSHAVTSGTSRRERESWSAITLRTPEIGVRATTARPVRPSTAPGCAAASAAGTAATDGAWAGAACGAEPSAAASTSARVIRPSGPVPVSAATSTPFSRASLRTIGEVTRGAPASAVGAGVGRAAPRPRLDGRLREVALWPEVP